MSVINLKDDIVQINKHFHALNLDLISVSSTEINKKLKKLPKIQTYESDEADGEDDDDSSETVIDLNYQSDLSTSDPFEVNNT